MLQDIDIQEIQNIAQKAAHAVMNIYNTDFDVTLKKDNSPLTRADLEANEIICNSLKECYPNIPIISEENEDISFSIRKEWEYYWCIDPIDGTKEFIQKNGEFTINIALIHHNSPVLGVVYAPALDTMYSAKQNEGAYKNRQKLPLYTNKSSQENITVVVSRSHLSHETQNFIDTLPAHNIKQLPVGSSLKLCMVASGEADLYPKLGSTMEWDTAAAHAVVLESGKNVFEYQSSKQISYNKKNLHNPWFIVSS